VHTRHGRDVHATRRQVAMFRQLAKGLDRLVCVSEEVAALSRLQGVASPRLRTILNGIDLDRFGFIGPGPAGPAVTVARLSPEKDVANLVRAAAMAPGLRIEVAGGGPCREELDRLAVELGVADRITFLGELRDVPAVLRRASMFVLPSRSEGIPLTVLEAMACGLPVVATRVGGLPEVVDDGVTGMLVPPADPAALAAAMRAIRDDPRYGDQLGLAGRRRVEEYFSVRRMVAQYEQLYREELDSGRRPGVDGEMADPIRDAADAAIV
jgi:glycosyltransferase involved in cell wall biosynthesis